jgi:flagellar hook protein FlgE
MFTAISSLNLHQSYLDVVANNLANANTTGYKASRVVFQDQFSQMLSPGAGPSATQGGVNPIQVGLGTQLGYISPVFSQGMLQATGRNMDISIQGDGFFIYGEGVNRRYSREGSTSLDSTGNIVNGSTGLRLQGWLVDGSGNVDPNMPAGDMQLSTDGTVARATSNAIIGGNLSADGIPVNDPTVPVDGTFTNTMGLYDSLGELHTASVTFTRTGNNTWDWAVSDPVTGVGNGTLTFNTEGQISASSVTNPISIPGSQGANPIGLTIDFGNMTMLAGDNSVSVISQDGLPTGTVTDLYITPKDGQVYLVYSNGMREQVAQIAIARFNNPAGLIKSGNTMFQQGLNSGEPQVGLANNGGRGSIAAGYLEASNVDMAQEFTNMILAQRGFQASSRVITTSDEIMQELVNLKR